MDRFKRRLGRSGRGVALAVLYINEPGDMQSWPLAALHRFVAGPMLRCPRNKADPLYHCFRGDRGLA